MKIEPLLSRIRADKFFTIPKKIGGKRKYIINGVDKNIRFFELLPVSKSRKAEGGLRVQGIFKRSEKDLPLVSIITVVLNGEQYLEEAVRSVINQTYNNVEYIVIDGGSGDGTLEIINKYNNQIDYWVSESDDGIADAFNKGISLCAGEIIGIINADDWYELDAIEKIVELRGRSAVFCGNVQYWDGYRKDYIFSTNIPGLLKEMTVNHPAVFVCKDIYKKYGVFDSEYRYAMDYELLLRFYKNGVEYISVNSVLANMRLAGLSDTNRKKSYRDVRLAKMQHGEYYLVAFGYYFKQLVRKKISDLLTLLGLESTVMLYRRKRSIIKKTKT